MKRARGTRGPRVTEAMTRSRRKIAALLAVVATALALSAGPADAGRASGVCGGTEVPPGSNNC